MKLECEDWTANSFRVNVFAKILNRSGTASGFYPDLIISIFHDVLNKEVEPELQLKMFLTLSKLLYDVKNTLDSQNEFKQFVLKLVLELIFPALKWKSGRKCEAVRIAATSSLWSVFNSGSLEPKGNTVWKFHDFSITQILREINYGDSRSAKSFILTHSEALNFEFY